MAKKQKLKDRLQKALAAKEKAKFAAAIQAAKSTKEVQHDPASMTVRHAWSDGCETEIPYRCSPGQKILIIGDGDLSFSVALASLLGEDAKGCLMATTLDSYSDLERKYGKEVIDGHLAKLSEASATVLHGIDGTKLHLNKIFQKHFFSRIIFNYPHTGAGIKDRDRNIRAQQEMLKSFFGSASQLLVKKPRAKLLTRSVQMRNKDAPLVTKRKQKKTGSKKDSDQEDDDDDDFDSDQEEASACVHPIDPEIHVTIKTGDPYDAWNIKGLAATTGTLKSAETFRFEPFKYPGYRHVKTLGADADEDEDGDGFLLKPAKTFVIRTK